MDGLIFDEAGHTYRLDGHRVLGVTEALKPISAADYFGVDPEVMDRKARIGTAVHKVIELDCQNDLDVDDLDDLLLPYYRAWRSFLVASGFRVVLSESKVASRRHGYAGQLDLFGELLQLPATVDAKCVTAIMSSTGPQTMAYTDALRECRPDLLPAGMPCRRYALQLRPLMPDGRPATTPWMLHQFTDDAADRRLFQSSLNVSKHLHRKTLA